LYIPNVFLTEGMQIARFVSTTRWSPKINVGGRFEEKQSLRFACFFNELLREIVAINVFLLTQTTYGY
jgi:hypothetical protein